MDAIEVFLSSKQSEFEIERALMVERIRGFSMLEAINAEDWSPESTPVRELMIDKLNRSMIYVGLFGTIYSEPTELEYRAAFSNPYRERMIYVKQVPDEKRAPELRLLINDFNAQNVVAKFSDVRDLLPKFSRDLSNALVRIALKLRKLGEPAPLTKGVNSPMLRRWAAERKQVVALGLENRTPEEIAELARRIEAETQADGAESRGT